MPKQYSHSEPLTFGQFIHQLQQDKWLSEEDAQTLLVAPKGSAQAAVYGQKRSSRKYGGHCRVCGPHVYA